MINKKIENQSNDSLFFTRSNLDNSKVDKIVSDALHKADDGELSWNSVKVRALYTMIKG